MLRALFSEYAPINGRGVGKDTTMEWLLNRAIAHRGLHDEKIAENSIEAFTAAMNGNYAIELDVHLTRDHHIVVFHDDDLYRMTGVQKEIKDCTMEELQNLTLAKTNCHIPTLKETLHFVADEVPLLIEIKYDLPIGLLEEQLLTLLEGYDGRFALQSFDPLRLRWFKNHAPHIARGQLITDVSKKNDLPFYKKIFLQSMQIVKLSDPQFLSLNKACLSKPAFSKEQAKGRYLFGWTFRDEKVFDQQKSLWNSMIFEKFKPHPYLRHS